MLVRILGFVGCAAIYTFIAAYFLFLIMIGDCDPEPVAHAKCEAFRNRELIVWLVVSGAAYLFLALAFFVRGRRSKAPN